MRGSISIHALREEGDQTWAGLQADQPISIHALREEGDQTWAGLQADQPISIHALREEGDVVREKVPVGTAVISIHALREEGDCVADARGQPVQHFNPRPP